MCVKKYGYAVTYDLVSDSYPPMHLSDTVSLDYPMSASEIAVHLSLTWALVRSETNDLTNLVIRDQWVTGE